MVVKSGFVAALVLLTGCATLPSGPSVTALPGSGKSFEQFRADDQACRHYGDEQVSGLTPARAQDEAVAKSAVAGGLLGAAAGAAIDGGHGAAIGAGAGVLIGSVAGIDAGYGPPTPLAPATTQRTCNACTPRGIACRYRVTWCHRRHEVILLRPGARILHRLIFIRSRLRTGSAPGRGQRLFGLAAKWG